MALAIAGAAVAPAAASAFPTTGAASAHAASPAPARAEVTPGALQVTILAPLTTPPSGDGLLDADTLAEYTAPDGLLTAQLDAYAGRPVALAIDPRILASIRLLGSSAPASATAWLTRLAAAPNDTFLLEYADADPAALAAVGALDLTDPSDLEALLDPARFGPRETTAPTPVPTETAQPDADGPPPLPTADELVAWDGALGQLAWPLPDSVTEAELDALDAAGTERIVLDAAQVSTGDRAVIALRDSGIQALVASSRLSDLARAVVDLPADGGGASIAELGSALASAAATGGSTVLTLDREWPLGGLHVDALLKVLRETPGVTVTGASALLAGEAPEAALQAPSVDTTDRDALLQQLVTERAALVRFSSVADEPALLTAPDRLRLLALAGVGWQTVAADWPAAVSAELDASRTLRAGVHVIEGSDLLVLSNSTGIPITVGNALDVPVTVVITARPLRPLLTIDPSPVTLQVAPDSSNRVYLPAQAVTNGVVPVRVTIRSTTGATIGPAATVRVDLQAQWETVGVVLGVVLVLVFVGGIVRNVLRRRRAARAEEAGSDPGSDPGPEARG